MKIFRYKKPKPEIYVPKGYELEDMLETDEQGYEPGEPDGNRGGAGTV